VIDRVLGFQVFPTVRRLEAATPPVAVRGRFRRRELWGADADATLKVSIDAFEPYLEAA